MKKSILLLTMLVLSSLNLFSQQGITMKPGNYTPVIVDNTNIIENYSPSDVTRHYKSGDGSLTAMIGPNLRIFPTNNVQTEPHASVWSVNSSYIFVSATTGPDIGYYSTANGGTNWVGSDTLSGTGRQGNITVASYNQNGTVIYNYSTLDSLLYADRTTNYGANWVGRVQCPTTGYLDFQEMAIDVTPTSPYFGRIYVVIPYWSTPAKISLTYSTNGGISFTPQQIIGSPVSGYYEQLPHVEVDKNGIVYCVWVDVMQVSPNTEKSIAFSKSTNGGVNWSSPTRIHNINGVRAGFHLTSAIKSFSEASIAIDRTGGVRNNWLYITWAQAWLSPAGPDPDICISRSSNGGLNWSAPVRVNNDSFANSRTQLFPVVEVDQVTGNVVIAFYDTRDVVTGNDSVNTYVAVSNNGGDTWQNIRVSDISQRPVPIPGWSTGFYTAHLAVTANNNVIHTFWPDNRSGPIQIYTSKIDITGIRKISGLVPAEYKLLQNYPNPFNPVTKITFDLPKSGDVKVTVFDLLGKEVATLVNEQLKPGTYELTFDGSNFSSGVYYYRITAGDFSETKKMMLVK